MKDNFVWILYKNLASGQDIGVKFEISLTALLTRFQRSTKHGSYLSKMLLKRAGLLN